ncbi:hypothetical protein ACFQ7W_00720 [Streptomyces niveus]|uniref:hypothetical protein n=1 Tax=Streptomyces niveus TaxID=193462 RepID=UPI00367CB4CF
MDAWIRFWTIVWVGWSDLNRRSVDFLVCAAPDKPNKQPAKGKRPEPEQPEEDTDTVGEEPPAKAEKEKPAPAPKKTPAAAGGSPALRIGSTLIVILAVYGTPWTTRIVLGLAAAWTVTALALGYLALAPEPEEPAEDDQEPEEPAEDVPHPSETLTLDQVAQLLHDAYTEGSGVHLATLRGHLHGHPIGGLPAAPWKPQDVRALLARHTVRVRPGVRVPPVGGREGVHRDDFPPLLSPGSVPASEGVVVPGQTGNNNSNNTGDEAPREGLTIVPDPKNNNRWLVQHDH